MHDGDRRRPQARADLSELVGTPADGMKQGHDQLEQYLREQLGFLRASGAAFDAGDEPEATRMIMPIRSVTRHSSDCVAASPLPHAASFLPRKNGERWATTSNDESPSPQLRGAVGPVLPGGR
jgi:hypothetical protein